MRSRTAKVGPNACAALAAFGSAFFGVALAATLGSFPAAAGSFDADEPPTPSTPTSSTATIKPPTIPTVAPRIILLPVILLINPPIGAPYGFAGAGSLLAGAGSDFAGAGAGFATGSAPVGVCGAMRMISTRRFI